MLELRQIPRWQIGEKVKMKLREQEWEGRCCLEDINLKGMKISLKEQLPEQSEYELLLDLNNYLMLNVQVRLCWNKEMDGRHYYGLEFSRIKDQDKEEISQYLQKNCLDQFKEHWWPKEGEQKQIDY